MANKRARKERAVKADRKLLVVGLVAVITILAIFVLLG